jgi:ubiquitin-conjugating enzyme E2 S
VPFPESALNEEAGRLFMESYEEFFSQAKIYTDIHARPNQK